MIPIRSAGLTHVGKKRDHNEDAFAADDELHLHIVADGMGGHSSGEVASAQAIASVRAALLEKWTRLKQLAADWAPESHRELELLMTQALQRACAQVFELSEADARRKGMGTTCVALLCLSDKAVIGHVGDSRAYLVRKGEVHQLTDDHTLVREQVRRGFLTEEEAKNAPNKNILLRCIGLQAETTVDTLVIDVMPGDYFILCTDGLHEYLGEGELAKVIDNRRTVESLPKTLVDLANARGGKDNVTAVVVAAGSDDLMHTDMGVKADTLRQIPLFAQASYREALELLAISQVRRYERGRGIVSEGDPGEELFAILTGQVEVSRGGTPLVRLRRGGYFGELVVFDKSPRSASVIAVEDTSVLAINRDGLIALMQRDSELALKLLWSFGRILANRLRATNTRLETVHTNAQAHAQHA